MNKNTNTNTNSNSNSNSNTNASNQTSTPSSTDILIATLGDGITAIAAGLALEALEHPKGQRSQVHGNSSKQLETTEEQLDLIMSELAQIRSLFR
ncbi:translation initiation factor 2 [Paenibacillus pinisoli]|uniref:translation initiation factor 2 n=1 Tax=Paenibacillus pinisoli TaxID=1276110 RepID=UPI0010588DC0|nr:translation initiation factor 2 [Paenibacillus pinisoli]